MARQRDRSRVRFILDAFSPESIPMARLSIYMADFATLLGEKENVHFEYLEKGSTAIVATIEREAVPKVEARIRSVKHHDGPDDALRAFRKLNTSLAEDNASAELEFPDQQGRILHFPGRELLVEQEYGPFNQDDSLYGVPIVVGGKGEYVPIHLQDVGDSTLICEASRAIAKDIAKHLFESPIKATGTARWYRDKTGTWEMRNFRICTFEVLKDKTLRELADTLRQIEAPWKSSKDPVADLLELRKGPTKG